MLKATVRMISAMIGQPDEIAIGPPNCPRLPVERVKHPASTEMIENEIAKFAKLRPAAVELLLVAELG